MLEKTTRILSENFARSINRRSFLKHTGEATFGAMMALAAGHLKPALSSASGITPPEPTPACSPPGPYCNTGSGNLSGCHGAHCFEHMYNSQVLQCRVYYQYYQAGCWTTSSGGGYWTCCDCQCYSGTNPVTTCGCAQFSTSPSPSPDRVGGLSAS